MQVCVQVLLLQILDAKLAIQKSQVLNLQVNALHTIRFGKGSLRQGSKYHIAT